MALHAQHIADDGSCLGAQADACVRDSRVYSVGEVAVEGLGLGPSWGLNLTFEGVWAKP